MTPRQAYDICRNIARAEAKNFYHAFRVLPQAKSDAMCAMYAFMRRADDLADDESKSIPDRRTAMSAWLEQWHQARTSGTSEDPVFVAVRDTQQRFQISDALLDQLVQGTAMDLEETQPGVLTVTVVGRQLQVYETFEDLYRYCYLVASVVGLVSIKIFGYTNPAADLLAERTGIAFQLTNILRDVKEDIDRGRVYLPQQMLDEFAVSLEDLLALASGRPIKPNERAMLGALSVQAWEYYESSRQLLPMISPDSRPALWVLVEIYSRLLGRVDLRQGDVFTARLSVPATQKFSIMARGAFKALASKVSSRGPRSRSA